MTALGPVGLIPRRRPGRARGLLHCRESGRRWPGKWGITSMNKGHGKTGPSLQTVLDMLQDDLAGYADPLPELASSLGWNGTGNHMLVIMRELAERYGWKPEDVADLTDQQIVAYLAASKSVRENGRENGRARKKIRRPTDQTTKWVSQFRNYYHKNKNFKNAMALAVDFVQEKALPIRPATILRYCQNMGFHFRKRMRG